MNAPRQGGGERVMDPEVRDVFHRYMLRKWAGDLLDHLAGSLAGHPDAQLIVRRRAKHLEDGEDAALEAVGRWHSAFMADCDRIEREAGPLQ